jgi:hypothetical protein
MRIWVTYDLTCGTSFSTHGISDATLLYSFAGWLASTLVASRFGQQPGFERAFYLNKIARESLSLGQLFFYIPLCANCQISDSLIYYIWINSEECCAVTVGLIK